MKKKEEVEQGEVEGLTSCERVEVAPVAQGNAELRMERDVFKCSVALWVKDATGQ